MFFEETASGFFVTNCKFGVTKKVWDTEQYKEIDEFCCKIRDGISEIIEQKKF